MKGVKCHVYPVKCEKRPNKEAAMPPSQVPGYMSGVTLEVGSVFCQVLGVMCHL